MKELDKRIYKMPLESYLLPLFIFSIIKGKNIKIQIWDTAGQEKHNSLTAGFYRNCIGVIFMYDMTQLNSLNHLKDWYKRVKYGTDTRFVSVIVGNKHDLGELCAVKEIDKKHISRYIDESEVIEVSC